MRKIIAALSAAFLLCFAFVAQAQMNLLTGAGGKFRAAAASVTFAFSFVDSKTDSSNTSPITYAAMNFGAADSNRVLAAVISARENAPTTINGVTIGGVTASLVNAGGTTNCSQTTPNANVIAIYQASVPAGTSGDVVVTYGANGGRSFVGLYRIVTATPAATNSGCASNTASIANTVATTVPSGGGGFTGFWEGGGIGAITWTNATQDVQGNDPSTNSRYSSATITGTGSVSVQTSGTGNGSLISWASWGP
jgi:hypothetical protein